MVFLANVLFPLKAKGKKKKEKSVCILEIREQTEGWESELPARPEISTRQSQISSSAQIQKCSAGCFLTTGMGCDDKRPKKPGLGGHLPLGLGHAKPPSSQLPFPNLSVLVVEGGVRDESSSGVSQVPCEKQVWPLMFCVIQTEPPPAYNGQGTESATQIGRQRHLPALGKVIYNLRVRCELPLMQCLYLWSLALLVRCRLLVPT